SRFAVDPLVPASITAGPDGALWFTNRWLSLVALTGDMSLHRLTTSGALTAVSTPNFIPFAVTTGADGNLWATDDSSGIARISTGGSVLVLPTPGVAPHAITAGPDGALWFDGVTTGPSATGVIGRMATDGTWTTVTSSVSKPVDTSLQTITTGPDGNIWCSCGARVKPPGTVLSGSPGITLAPGQDGNVWFNSGTNVGSATPNLTITSSPIPGAPTSPFIIGGIASGSDANMWFVDHDQGKLGRIITGA